VRERVDAGNRQAEVRIELVGDPERVGLEAQPQQAAISVEGVPDLKGVQACQILGRERHLSETLGACADQSNRPRARPVGLDGFHAHRLVEEGTRHDLAGSEGKCGGRHQSGFGTTGVLTMVATTTSRRLTSIVKRFNPAMTG